MKAHSAISILRWILFVPVACLGSQLIGMLFEFVADFLALPQYAHAGMVGAVSAISLITIGLLIAPRKNREAAKCILACVVIIIGACNLVWLFSHWNGWSWVILAHVVFIWVGITFLFIKTKDLDLPDVADLSH